MLNDHDRLDAGLRATADEVIAALSVQRLDEQRRRIMYARAVALARSRTQARVALRRWAPAAVGGAVIAAAVGVAIARGRRQAAPA